ncbi:hypothetical protein BKA70DRAFT_106225 [Coprinopsis sp. MPI-PUGE-AT-0042]|nr:hypothetical protein BKA70DRAFT_106225 [Coprinopsis sp. MPI-PUGE-AT-0042]
MLRTKWLGTTLSPHHVLNHLYANKIKSSVDVGNVWGTYDLASHPTLAHSSLYSTRAPNISPFSTRTSAKWRSSASSRIKARPWRPNASPAFRPVLPSSYDTGSHSARKEFDPPQLPPANVGEANTTMRTASIPSTMCLVDHQVRPNRQLLFWYATCLIQAYQDGFCSLLTQQQLEDNPSLGSTIVTRGEETFGVAIMADPCNAPTTPSRPW